VLQIEVETGDSVGEWRRLSSPDLGQLGCCHTSRGASSCLLAQGSFGAVMCLMELYGLWVIEVNKYFLMVLPS
jgi:hypothetical protein